MQLMRKVPENRALMVTEADRPAMRALALEETIQVSGGVIIFEGPPAVILHGPAPALPGPTLRGPIILSPHPTLPGLNQPDYLGAGNLHD